MEMDIRLMKRNLLVYRQELQEKGMSSLNKVMIIGNLGADPEIRNAGNGNPVCNLSVATHERWTDKEGQPQERTEWHRVVVWGPQAENCAKYLAKGRQVYVEGSLQTRKYDDKDGTTRYTTEIKAHKVNFLQGGERSPDKPQNNSRRSKKSNELTEPPF